ncbi:AEC family transporter [Brackiella oedipodis]|uniref:AEC family transporter n=1 Tax=Brackiella oedipodis TaxID=124225 RepID=UPI00048F07DE|nr:hypothetical protein [Brackiella oedipodis]
MSTLLPLIYLIAGMTLGRFYPTIREPLSKIVTRIIIPYVIIYNLADYHPGTAVLAVGGFLYCLVMFGLAKLFWRHDRMAPLLVSYINFAWLALPVAIALFGDEASRVVISAYIGNSVFGNTFSVMVLQKQHDYKSLILKTLRSPAIIAVFIGIILRLVYPQITELDLIHWGFQGAKIAMSIMGMCILGIWLYSAKITTQSVISDIPLSIVRFFLGYIVLFGFYHIAVYFDILPSADLTSLILCPMMPPAANLVVLETYYLRTGTSAKRIASGTVIALFLLGVFAVLDLMGFLPWLHS